VITGNGLKTTDAIAPTAAAYPVIEPRLEAFERAIETAGRVAPGAPVSSGPIPDDGPTSSGRPAPAAPLSSGRAL